MNHVELDHSSHLFVVQAPHQMKRAGMPRTVKQKSLSAVLSKRVNILAFSIQWLSALVRGTLPFNF
jgi:hypothetical protein